MSAAVELRGVSKRFGSVLAVDGVSLTVAAGEFLTLLGPSGCGKTTLLRLIAGFERADSGSVWLGARDVSAVPPHQRDVNQVFQSYALFPHLTARENVAFGLKRQGLPAHKIAARVDEMVALMALVGCEDRRPHQLSGGQQQRVALARALAPGPAVLLLDEPLSALDARLRQTMQIELKRLQRKLGTTFILVTHDQDEALTMSDRIALLNGGRVEQVGPPHELYHRPRTKFAAEFMGHENVWPAAFLGFEEGHARIRVNGGPEIVVTGDAWPDGMPAATIAVRADRVEMTRPGERNHHPGFQVRIEERMFRGSSERFVVSAASGLRIVLLAPSVRSGPNGWQAGQDVWCRIRPEDVVVIPGGD